MNEEEFDSMACRPFRREDLTQAGSDAGRFTSLSLALWGRTPDDLARRLAAPAPQILPGCTIADLRRLQDYIRRLAVEAGKPQNSWLRPLAFSSLGMVAGSQASKGLEDRLEVLRRAIEHFEK
jgi:hypothetical protein